MRARPRLILTLLALLVPASGAVLAAATTTAATATQLSADATPLFTVTPAPACHEPLCFWADSRAPGASLTLSRTHMLMINPEIVDTTRGIAHISADRGEENGPEVGNSRWTFTGHIRADMSGGQLRADTATVQIVDGRIVSIDAQGGPALFQRPASADNAGASAAADASAATGKPAASGGEKAGFADVTVRGHADSITYDAMHNQVQFSGNSWFTDGCNEITSQLVTYDMQTQTVKAGAKPGSSGRVQGVIRNTRAGGNSSSCTADTGHS
jgi:lipopolysaccharide export system protein LptA